MRIQTIKLSTPLKVLGDGAIAMPDIGDGRLIPVIIIDCDTRRDLYDLVMAHEESLPGDVSVTWFKKIFSKKSIYLLLRFIKPVETECVIEFDIGKYGGVVDLIINARAFYFQPKDSGLKVSTSLDKPKIIIEVPSETKLDDWDSMLTKHLVKKFLKQGASKKEAIAASKVHIENWRRTALREPPKSITNQCRADSIYLIYLATQN